MAEDTAAVPSDYPQPLRKAALQLAPLYRTLPSGYDRCMDFVVRMITPQLSEEISWPKKFKR